MPAHPSSRRMAFAALGALVATVVGAPSGLWWAATSLAARPAWRMLAAGHLVHIFERPVSDAEVIASLVLLGAAAWSWIMACLAVELASCLRGVAAPRLPGSAHMQHAVGVVLGLALTLLPVVRAGAAVPTATARPHAAVTTTVPRLTGIAVTGATPAAHRMNGTDTPRAVAGARAAAGGPAAGPVRAPDQTATTEPPARMTPDVPVAENRADAAVNHGAGDPVRPGGTAAGWIYTVRPGDTLWSIAAQQLGDPLRWRLIAAANLGRAQPGGATFADDHWIMPGWTLLLPAGLPPTSGGVSPAATATAVRAAAMATAASPASVGATATAGPLATAAATAATATAASPASGSAAALPAGAPARSSDGASGSVGSPGSLGTRGGTPASKSPGAPEAPVVSTEGAAEPAAHVRHGGSRRLPAPGSVAPMEIVEFGLMAAALVALVDRLRRVQQRNRVTGLRIALPAADVAALDGTFRRRMTNAPQRALAVAFGQLHHGARRAGVDAPLVCAVRIGPAMAELSIASATDGGGPPLPFPPFEGGAGPGQWRLRLGSQVEAAGGSLRGPWPVGPDGLSPVEPDDPWVAGREDQRHARRGVRPARRGDRSALSGGPAGVGGWEGLIPATAVTIGRAGDALLVIDLNVLGAMSIDDGRADAMCRAMAVELAARAAADDTEVVLVGFDPVFAVFDQVRRVDTARRALDMAERTVATRRSDGRTARTAALPDRSPATVVMLAPDAWEPRPDVDAECAECLVDLAMASGGSVAVVFGWPVTAAPWRLCSRQDGDVDLYKVQDGRPDGEPCTGGVDPQRLGPAAASAVAALVGTATDSAGVPEDTPPYDAIDSTPARECAAAAPEPDVAVPEPGSAGTGIEAGTAITDLGTAPRDAGGGPPAGAESVRQVEVRVLGPVEVTGAERPFTRAWTLDLVVYLALHPSGATTDQWSTALWPDRLMAPASLHSTASAARRALGADDEGTDHLPRAHGRLQLGPGVATDWARFDRWARSDDPRQWRAALALIRGRPLDGLRVTDWALLEGLLPAIEATAVDLAERYGLWCLQQSEATEAQWAARRGLLVSPYDERLYRILLRAADLAGNPAGVEATMAELVRLVAEDVEPFDAVHPETLDLYRALSRRGAQMNA